MSGATTAAGHCAGSLSLKKCKRSFKKVKDVFKTTLIEEVEIQRKQNSRISQQHEKCR